MILSFEQLISKIEKHQPNYMVVYEGHRKIGKDDPHIDRFSTDSYVELLDSLKEFAQIFPGNYTIQYAKGTSLGSSPFGCKVKIEPQTVSSNSSGSSHDISVIVSQQVEAKIKEYEAHQQAREKEAEIASLKEQLKGAQDNGKLIGSALAQAAQIIFPGLASVEPVEESAAALNGADNDALVTALEKLTKALGAETIIKLAAKLETPQGRNMLPMIKNFANG